jgi:4'-phosphopantetheinyl transferase
MKYYVEKIENLITKKELQEAILSFGMERKKEIQKSKNTTSVMESVAATILMDQLLVDSGYLSDDLIKDKNGAPRFLKQKDLYCSISHSNEYVACAISDYPIGIDIQKMKEVNQVLLSKRFFSEQEKLSENFYQIWTSKESYLKMIGIGLKKELNSFYTDLKKNQMFDLNGNIIGNLFYKEYEQYVFCICMQEKI